jgi:hypothetical protein
MGCFDILSVLHNTFLGFSSTENYISSLYTDGVLAQTIRLLRRMTMRGLKKKLMAVILAISMVTTYAGMTVSAGVITNLSDGGSSGTGGSGAEGDWGSFTDSATVYRIYPIKIPDVSAYNSITEKLVNGAEVSGTSINSINLIYKGTGRASISASIPYYDNYYKYRDLALYEVLATTSTSLSQALSDTYMVHTANAYEDSGITLSTLKSEGLVLGADGSTAYGKSSLLFSEIFKASSTYGTSKITEYSDSATVVTGLNLPCQKILTGQNNDYEYYDFSDELKGKITTEKNGNVRAVIANYVAYLTAKKSHLSSGAKSELAAMAKDFNAGGSWGLVVELCAPANQLSGGKLTATGTVFSGTDLSLSGVGADAHYADRILNGSNAMTWNGVWKNTQTKPPITYTFTSCLSPTDSTSARGLATFLTYNTDDSKAVHQEVNVTLLYDSSKQELVNTASSVVTSTMSDTTGVGGTFPDDYSTVTPFYTTLIGWRDKDITATYLKKALSGGGTAVTQSNATNMYTGYDENGKKMSSRLYKANLVKFYYVPVTVSSATALNALYSNGFGTALEGILNDLDIKSVKSSQVLSAGSAYTFVLKDSETGGSLKTVLSSGLTESVFKTYLAALSKKYTEISSDLNGFGITVGTPKALSLTANDNIGYRQTGGADGVAMVTAMQSNVLQFGAYEGTLFAKDNTTSDTVNY